MEIVDGVLLKVSSDDIVRGLVKIPNGVKTIGSNAFSNLFELISVEIPNSVTKIESYAFSNCKNLKSINIPEGVISIDDYAFSACSKLASVSLPNTLQSIGKNSFAECTKLKTIFVPNSVKTIDEYAFYDCENLKSIHLPESLTVISNGLFTNCYDLKNINFPNTLEVIGDSAFANCQALKTVTLPDNISQIREGAFLGCTRLSQINIPKNVHSIDIATFSFCRALKSIVFHENVEKISKDAFSNCKSLTSVIIPSNVEIVGDNAFLACSNLYNIEIQDGVKEIGMQAFAETPINSIYLPKSIEFIDEDAFHSCDYLETATIDSNISKLSTRTFADCTSLKFVNLPETLTSISSYAFFNCASLKSIKLPDSVQSIGEGAFYDCLGLYLFNMPKSLVEIKSSAFYNCQSIRELNFPPSLETIERDAFNNCGRLYLVNFSEGLKNIEHNAFFSCDALTSIKLPSTIKKVEDSAFSCCFGVSSLFVPKDIEYFGSSTLKFKYMQKTDEGFNFSLVNIPNSINLKDVVNFDFSILASNYDHYEMLMKEQKNPAIAEFYNYMLTESDLSLSQQTDLLNNHSFTFFKKIMNTSPYRSTNIYTFLYDLGAVSKPIEVNGKKVDYAQKVSEFLLDKINRQDLSLEEIAALSMGMKDDGFKKGFTDFFLSNFYEFLKETGKNENFFSMSYNYFDEVQKTNTSNRGDQRQLKPTIEKFITYFAENKFNGINENNRQIAETISPYFNSQEAFDLSVKIFDEKKQNNVPDNILSEPLKETDIFDNITKYEEGILDLQVSTLRNLAEAAGIEFSYEWLAKNDPTNLILGKLCNCCAHLEGAGFGIMKASIVHPNIQNLVIRNSSGEIIAKSTLFINPEQGYGVFNNVEINSNYIKDKKILAKIYDKYIAGVRAFVEKYNNEHPDQKITQINVGMGFNDLKNEIKANNKRAPKLLKAIDYSEYNAYPNGHQGDSYDSQYVLWQDNNLEK